MRIQLINPPNSGRSIPEERYGVDAVKLVFRGEPLSLETLAGNLDDHEVIITDLKVVPDELQEDFHRFQPDMVGITAMTCEANAALDIAATVKAESDAIVVIGGHHASCDASYFDRESVDYVISGLGKASFRELADALEANPAGPADPVPGAGKIMPGEKLVIHPRQFSEADLVDDAPPRYDLVARHRDQYVMSGVGGKIGFVASAHGCTHSCAFCAVPPMTGGRYIPHSPEAVVRDMQTLSDIPLIRLVDANTFGRPETAERLGGMLIDAGWSTGIVADVRSDTVTRHPELFALWKQAGLAAAVIGFEEISDERLAAMNKKNKVAVNREAMDILTDLGIRIIGDFIVSPEYDHADFDRLRRFVADSPIDLPVPTVMTPMPGTPFYARMKDRITETNLDYYTFLNAVTPTRLPESDFYKEFAALLGDFLNKRHHKKPVT